MANKIPTVPILEKISTLSCGMDGWLTMGNQELVHVPALSSSALSRSTLNVPPMIIEHQRELITGIETPTTNSLAKSNELSQRNRRALDTSYDWPFAFIVNGSSYNIGYVLNRS